MTEIYKRPLLIKFLNLFLFPREYDFYTLEKWYISKFQKKLPAKVSKYLKLIMDEIYRENSFDPLGKLLFNQFLFDNLKNLAYVEKHGVVTNINPLFIISMPRTGSTFFHKYLASDKQFRTLSFWELNRIGLYSYAFFRKIQGRIMLLMQNYLIPKIKYVHAVDNDGPEECSKILLCSFITQIYPLMFNLPQYEKELINENFDYTYEFYTKALSLIKNKNDKTLLLKAPMHIQALDQLQKYFPKAKFIFLHRDLKSVLPSAYSLAFTYSHMFCPKFDLKLKIKSINKRLSHDLKRAMNNSQNENFLHLNYSQIMQERGIAIQSIEKLINKEINIRYREKDKKHKKHKYEKLELLPEEFEFTLNNDYQS